MDEVGDYDYLKVLWRLKIISLYYTMGMDI